MEASKPSRNHYDAVVVGAGISGMMAATHLSYEGRRVLVVEHNHQAGGLMAGVNRKDFYFDVGCQSFENMGIVFPLLEQYGLAHLFEFHRVRYRLKMPDIDTVVMTLEQTRNDFKRAYPELASGFDRIFDTHEKVADFIRSTFKPESVPYVTHEKGFLFKDWIAPALKFSPNLKQWMFEDFEDWYRRILISENSSTRSRGVTDLLATCGYTRMNVFIASAFWHLWAEDYWYPKGGYKYWFDQWVAALQRRGVEFLFKNRVVALEQESGHVTAIKTNKEHRIQADQFVYTGDYKFAVNQLIGRKYFSEGTLSKLDNAKHSDPLTSVYLGLNLPVEKLKEILKTSHIFYFPDYKCRTEMNIEDIDAHSKAFLEVTAHCIDDPSLAPEGKSSLVLQTFSRAEWAKYWRTRGELDHRSLDYRAIKRTVADQIVSVFEGIFPDVRKYIEYCDVGTPLSAYHFTRNHLGGSCGFELNWKAYPFLQPLAHTETPVKNLHMAGHFTVWPGSVPTAALSGKIAAVRAHEGMVREIQKSGVLRAGYSKTYSILREHGKTFYVMAKLLGPKRGNGIAAVYGFARTSDDTVDRAEEGASVKQIKLQLDAMAAQLTDAVALRPTLPEYTVLAKAIRDYEIPLYPFEDLLKGVAMDLDKTRYATYEELELYCYRVAGTIGLMITPIAGFRKDTPALEYAKTLGTAFQLTNILRDVGEDLGRDRIYLPKEDLDRFGVTEEDLKQGICDEDFVNLMKFQIARARKLYEAGLKLIPLVTSLQGRLAFRFAIDAYSGILEKIEANNYDVFSRRAHLTAKEKIQMIPHSLMRASKRSMQLPHVY